MAVDSACAVAWAVVVGGNHGDALVDLMEEEGREFHILEGAGEVACVGGHAAPAEAAVKCRINHRLLMDR